MENIDIPEQVMINFNHSEMAMNAELSAMDSRTFVPNRDDSYGDFLENIDLSTTSASWIFSIFVSSLIGMVVFSPVILYLKQYWRVWRYDKDEINETFYFTHKHNNINSVNRSKSTNL